MPQLTFTSPEENLDTMGAEVHESSGSHASANERPPTDKILSIGDVAAPAGAKVRKSGCNRCNNDGLSCSGGRQNMKSCNACLKDNQSCSLLGPRPYLCESCGKGYAKECYLKVHKTKYHTENRPKPSNKTMDPSKRGCLRNLGKDQDMSQEKGYASQLKPKLSRSSLLISQQNQ